MKTILVPVDFSDVTPKLLAQAKTFASTFGARIVLIHVVLPDPEFVGFEPGPETVRQAVARDFKAEHERLEGLKGDLEGSGCDVCALQLQGPTAEKILEEATRLQADLIILGSHGHGALYRLLVGSVTEAVLKGAHCPVLVVSARESGSGAETKA